MGFEPTRAEHIGLAVQRLNHSATSSTLESWLVWKKVVISLFDACMCVRKLEKDSRVASNEKLKKIKTFPRAGFEPATYGFLQCSAYYSPPLYQLSYRGLYETGHI